MRWPRAPFSVALRESIEKLNSSSMYSTFAAYFSPWCRYSMSREMKKIIMYRVQRVFLRPRLGTFHYVLRGWVRQHVWMLGSSPIHSVSRNQWLFICKSLQRVYFGAFCPLSPSFRTVRFLSPCVVGAGGDVGYFVELAPPLWASTFPATQIRGCS